LTLQIEQILPASDHDWDETWLGCDYATYFHSREWARIWNLYTEGLMQPEPLMVYFSDGKCALLPLTVQYFVKGRVKKVISSPGGTFGGWISRDVLVHGHRVLLVRWLLRNSASLDWLVNPYEPGVGDIRFPAKRVEDTQVLDLDKGYEAYLEEITRHHSATQRKGRKAQKAGVLTREAVDIKDWQEYFQVYQDSLRRWGDTVSAEYEWSFFHDLFSLHSRYVKLWLSTFQEKIIAGALCFYAGRHVVYWHGAALEEYLNLRPVNLLFLDIIKDTCDKGYRWFDFNPSGKHEGVRRFKKTFGCIDKYCPVVKCMSPGARFWLMLSKVKEKMRKTPA